MQMSRLTEYDVYPATTPEVVARHGRSFAEIQFAYCDDGRFRFALSVQYSYGGYGGPIFAEAPSYSDMSSARVAALEAMLSDWPKAFASDPASVHEELRLMREQIASQLRQPSLF